MSRRDPWLRLPGETEFSTADAGETSNYFGGSLGITLIGIVGAIVYHDQMAASVAAGAPGAADETIAGAAVASQRLPAAQAAELLRTAGDAFTSGLNLTGVIAAVIFGTLAIVIPVVCRTRETRELQPAG